MHLCMYTWLKRYKDKEAQKDWFVSMRINIYSYKII